MLDKTVQTRFLQTEVFQEDSLLFIIQFSNFFFQTRTNWYDICTLASR